MDPNTITAWSTFATAVGAFALIVVTIWIERSKRRHERANLHLQQIREYVFQTLQQQLTEHYLRILDRWDVLLQPINEELASRYDPVCGKVTERRVGLALRKSEPMPGATVGTHEQFVNYDATFRHLYEDAKASHFPDLLGRWEQFQQRVKQLGEEGLALCSSWEDELKKRLQFGDINGQSSTRPWANYPMITLYLYGLLWLKYPNAAGLFSVSDYWELRESGGNVLAQGSQEQMAMCREALAAIAKANESAMGLLFDRAELLKEEGERLKAEFEQLVLRHFSLGPCPYLEVPR